MAFDPNKKYSNELPPGSYLLAMVKFERRAGKRPPYVPYMNCSFRVIDGPAKGRQFFSSVCIDESNNGAMARLSAYCKACGVTQAFELSDDAAFGDAFMHKPFKASVKRSTSGDYVNNDIEKYETKLTQREIDIGDAYWNKIQDEADEGRNAGSTSDDFAGGGGDDFGGGLPPEDDIPFGDQF